MENKSAKENNNINFTDGENTNLSHIQGKDLSQVVLEMLASLNELEEHKKRLIEISAEGIIDDAELQELTLIQKDLNKVSMAISNFNLWLDSIHSKNTND